MEVFMHNLPRDLTDDGLRIQLEPFMKQLAIVDYLCEKPKRKPFGNVTFLDRRNGERFLSVHGQEVLSQGPFTRGRQPLKAKLQFMGTNIFCTPSRHQPQEFALKTLKHAAEQREKPPQRVEEEELSVSFSMRAFSCGHCTFDGDQLAYVPEVQWFDKGIMRFSKRNMVVKLDNKRIIRIPLNTVVSLVWFRDGSLTLTLSTVPLFFSDVPSMETILGQLLGVHLCSNTNSHVAEPNRSRLCSLGEKHAEVVGFCLVYQFSVSPEDLSRKIEELNRRGITIVRYDLSRTPLIDTGEFTRQLNDLKGELADYTKNNSLPFDVLYQLQALAYNTYLHPVTVLGLAKELCRMFRSDKATEKKVISVDAMRKLFDMIDWPFPHGEPTDFEVNSLVATLKRNEQEIRDGFAQRDGLFSSNQNLARINRVIATPTRITLHGPEMVPKNRILRKFPNHHEYFIRVQFCDENGQDLYFNPQVGYDDIYTRFKGILKRGIQIAGRTYSFLGFSHSSLRSHSVWFSSPFVDDNGSMQTYFTIIKALGNFSGITSPAKCAARIGQAFSETPFAVPLDENKILVKKIEDVGSHDGSRIFSDGVGTVSWDVMEIIRSYLPHTKGSPTCFQIRLGGAKGMLSLDSRLSGSLIQIRPSMTKFPSEDTRDLEICDMGSKPIPLVLNRQMIKILEDMGVADDWFLKLQNTELTRLKGVTANASNTARFLKAQSIGQPFRLHQLFRQCDLLNIDYRKEAFLRSVVEAAVLQELRLLKHKARIPVKEGITLFGIMDETGFLQENEVYVTFDTINGRYPPSPRQGQLLVTRSPALYDGDIQFANNVIPPRDHPLTEHRNCIVFSKKGSRDLPSQLSGGDLDGDIYNVIWDTEASPIRAFEPADYPRVKPINIERPVTVDDMANFFVDFMRTDHLGVIATRHMILADQMKAGTCDTNCKRLAQLHSTAVDFSKTGIAVKMEELPRVNNYRPDFLAPAPQAHIVDMSEIDLDQDVVQGSYDEDGDDSGPPRKYYKSEKILGKLYRAIDERKIWYEDVRSNFASGKASFWDEFIRSSTERCNVFGQIMWTHRSEEARRIRSAYEDAIFSTMNDFSEHPINPISEVEVFIGCIINKTGVQTRRQRDRSIKLKDEFERIAIWITGQMRRQNKSDIPLTGHETEFDALELCLACIHIGAERDELGAMRRRRNRRNELKSFRAVAASALLTELDLVEKGKKGRG